MCSCGRPRRVIIYMDKVADDIDFITMHNILYYLYTGCVNLRLRFSKREEFPPDQIAHPDGYPPKAEPLSLYKNAKKLLLDDLKDYCIKYLKATLSVNNVSKRLFARDEDLEGHDELVEMYVEYILTNFDKVKLTKEWKNALVGGPGFPETSKFRGAILGTITERLSFTEANQSSDGETDD